MTEIIDVGGKMQFSQYELVLQASAVPYAIIADLDYVEQVGSPDVKKLLVTSPKALKEKVVDDKTSIDGGTLVNAIDFALESGSWDQAKEVWEYIKSKRIALKPDLTDQEKETLRLFLAAKESENIFILSRGSLEHYLPVGHKNKDIEKLISFLDSDFWNLLDEGARIDLQRIADIIVPLSSDAAGDIG